MHVLMANLGVGVCKRHSGLVDLDAQLMPDCKCSLLGGGRRGRRRDTATPPQTTMRQAVVVWGSEAQPWQALVAGMPKDAQGQTARSRQNRWCRGWKPRALLLARPSSALAVALLHNLEQLAEPLSVCCVQNCSTRQHGILSMWSTRGQLK